MQTVSFRIFLFIFLALFGSFGYAQSGGPEFKTIYIQKSDSEFKIDGVLNEEAWTKAEMVGNFLNSTPLDTGNAKSKTEVRITYNDSYIIVGAICYDEIDGPFVIQSLKRDFSYPRTDAFAIYLDPFNDKTNGFSFAVNPYGVQREGLLQGGGNYGVSTAWDNVWYSEVKRYADKWIVEMAIPFKSIRFNDGIKEWGVNFSRNDLKRYENSSWSHVPRNFNIANLNFCGTLIWDSPPKSPGTNISIIPFTTGSISNDFSDTLPLSSSISGGMDAKIAISSSLNLDITVNPDFSQVEVDQQVTNLSRFSLFFPEKRNFFIENSDLFSNFGFSKIRPFFSRKIGLKNGRLIPIIAGARLSGKINQKWRIGLMNIQTSAVSEQSEFSQNYSVAAIQRQIWGNSNIGVIFVNRQTFTDGKFTGNDFNRIAGVDLNYTSKGALWKGKAFFHHSLSPGNSSNAFTHASWLNYSDKKLSFNWNHEYVDKNYQTDIGFVPRLFQYNPETGEVEKRSYWRLEPMVDYKIFPKSKSIQYHQFFFYYNNYLDYNLKPNDENIKIEYSLVFKNSSSAKIQMNKSFTRLFYDLDVTFSGKKKIPKGDYYYKNFGLSYNSDKRQTFHFTSEVSFGEYFNGDKIGANINLNQRIQPWGVLGLSIQHNEILMPNEYEDASITLVGPKFEFSFTRKIFLTTFLQYNTQQNNVNVNSRFQWRFKPMSDLYIVYTDNYYSDTFLVKNRTLVFKLIYWLNI